MGEAEKMLPASELRARQAQRKATQEQNRTALSDGIDNERVTTPRGSARVLKRVGARMRVEYADGRTGWIEAKDAVQDVSDAPSPAATASAGAQNAIESLRGGPRAVCLE